jgi:putative membrane-bound dehydrogenase-like protein
MRYSALPLLALLVFPALAEDNIKSRTTYSEAYGKTRNAVSVDAQKELPRYPAVEPSKAIATWAVKNGFRIEFTAHEPQVCDPVAMCFDERGRLFVCEMIDYSEMRDVSPHLGRISMLEDKDGDGFYETQTVFADNLPWPTGLIWANGGLYVGATPDVWRFEDRDGDGKAEYREKVFTGFGTGLKILNVQGLLNSFQWGQDNKIHVLSGGGNRGVITCLKRPDLAGQELGGQDFWFDPLSLNFGMEPGGAQYGMSFDNFGRKFGCSNSDHLQHWVYGELPLSKTALAMLPPSRQSIATDGGAAEVYRISPDEPWRILRTRWRIAGTVPGAVEGGGRVSGYFTGATGTTIYRGDAYGPDFINNSFTGDAGGQLVHRKIIRPSSDGISLLGSRPDDEATYEFAASKDTWVRVVNFANAPDGCLHVLDMYREVIEHPWSIPDEIKRHMDLNSGNDRGRIYRIAPKAGAPRIGTPVNMASADTRELVNLLSHPNGWHRDTAQRLLVEHQDTSAIALLETACESSDPVVVLHAMGALEGLKGSLKNVIQKALLHPSAHVRKRAIKIISTHASEFTKDTATLQALTKRSADENPSVRFELGVALASILTATDNQTLGDALFTLARTDENNEWISNAILGAPPETLKKHIFDRIAANPSLLTSKQFVSRLIEIRAATDSTEGRQELIQFLAKQESNPGWIKALGAGLRKAGLTIEKADTQSALAPVFTKAAELADDTNAAKAEKMIAIEMVGAAELARAMAPLSKWLSDRRDESIQTFALKTLAQHSDPVVTKTILSLWKEYGPESRSAALQVLMARPERTVSLLESIQAGAVEAQELNPSQIQSLIQSKDKNISALACAALAKVLPQSRTEVMSRFSHAITAVGDKNKGELLFTQRCAVCHQAGTRGNLVGPNLNTVKTKGREALLTAILDPNKEVASQYISYTVTTKQGEVYNGIISEDSASSMTLKMAGGTSQKIERAQIKGTVSTGQSLMPEGLEGGMNVQEMADLLSFIENLE